MTDFVDFGFPHAYECRALPEAPPARILETFPANSRADTGDLLVVEVEPQHSTRWLGGFVREFQGCPDGLFGCPDPQSLVVVAGGLAYVVAASDPTTARALPVIPTMTAFGDPSLRVLFLASFDKVFAFNAAMTPIWKSDLESDGIEFVGVADRILSVRGYMPASQDWAARQIPFADDAATSGE
ncbi:MAG: hypothetical protein ABR498_04820 [Candidatus Dormibacteria bacterium]